MSIFCIVKDNDEQFDTNIDMDFSYNTIEEWKHKWNPPRASGRKGSKRDYGYVTYKVTNESKHFPNSKFEDKALAIALRQWGLRTKDIRFKRVTGTADIEMKFADKKDDRFFRDKPSTLAYAYFPNGQKIGGDITFNDSVIWTTNGKPVNAHKVFPDKYPPNTRTKLRTYNMVHTLLHECGHAIGLKHCQQHKDCIMYPYYNGKVQLHNHDVQRIQLIYGARSLSKRITEYFRKRMLRNWGG
jgi:hypothetical protein